MRRRATLTCMRYPLHLEGWDPDPAMGVRCSSFQGVWVQDFPKIPDGQPDDRSEFGNDLRDYIRELSKSHCPCILLLLTQPPFQCPFVTDGFVNALGLLLLAFHLQTRGATPTRQVDQHA